MVKCPLKSNLRKTFDINPTPSISFLYGGVLVCTRFERDKDLWFITEIPVEVLNVAMTFHLFQGMSIKVK